MDAQLGLGFVSGSARGFMKTGGFVRSFGAEGGPAVSRNGVSRNGVSSNGVSCGGGASGRGGFAAGSLSVFPGAGPPEGCALGSSCFHFTSDRHAEESRHTREIQTLALCPAIAPLAFKDDARRRWSQSLASVSFPKRPTPVSYSAVRRATANGVGSRGTGGTNGWQPEQARAGRYLARSAFGRTAVLGPAR